MDKSLSSVAGILSPDGGIRVIIAEFYQMVSHVQPGETLFVVPNLFVEEPIEYDNQPSVIVAALKFVRDQLRE